jgi:hypothetical protein
VVVSKASTALLFRTAAQAVVPLVLMATSVGTSSRPAVAETASWELLIMVMVAAPVD